MGGVSRPAGTGLPSLGPCRERGADQRSASAVQLQDSFFCNKAGVEAAAAELLRAALAAGREPSVGGTGPPQLCPAPVPWQRFGGTVGAVLVRVWCRKVGTGWRGLSGGLGTASRPCLLCRRSPSPRSCPRARTAPWAPCAPGSASEAPGPGLQPHGGPHPPVLRGRRREGRSQDARRGPRREARPFCEHPALLEAP